MNPRVALNVFADEQLRRIKALPIHQRVVPAAPARRPRGGEAARQCRMARLDRHWQLRLEKYWN